MRRDVLMSDDVAGRPIRHMPAARRGAPWVEMALGDVHAAVASTKAAWLAWLATTRDVVPDAMEPVRLRSPDGRLWELTIGNTGTIGRRKVAG